MRSRPLLEDFREALLRMGGKLAEWPNGENPDRFIRSLFPQAQIICSATPEITGTRALSSGCEPADLADVDVGVVRAAFGVAETGSIWLSEQELRVNALASRSIFSLCSAPATSFLTCITPIAIRGSRRPAMRYW
jgi:L-lactate dehydrogenase complex protein LldG